MELVVKAIMKPKTPAMTAEEAKDPNLEYVWDEAAQTHTPQKRTTPRPTASAIDQLELETVFPEKMCVLASDNNISYGDRVLVHSHSVGKVIRVLGDGAFRVQLGDDDGSIITTWKQELRKIKE